MRRADLHIHSNVSDGIKSITEIIQMAKTAKLDAIAITDHDTLSHFNQIPVEKELQVLCGVELSAFDYEENMRAHILAYRIQRPEIIEEFCNPILEGRNANSLHQIQVLREHGYHIDEEKIKKADGKYIYKQHIMDYLVTTNQVDGMFGSFYYSTFKNQGMCHFDIDYLDVFKTIEIVKKAGGLAVLAHSGQQENFYLIKKLVELGLDGLELNHHANRMDHMIVIREEAKKYHLFLTGGSDFHGTYEPQVVNIGDFIAEESGYEAICINR